MREGIYFYVNLFIDDDMLVSYTCDIYYILYLDIKVEIFNDSSDCLCVA